MQFTITIPDDKLNFILDSFASVYNYSSTILDENGDETSNPESKEVFAKKTILAFIKEVHESAKTKLVETTRNSLIEEANNDTINITIE
jgi:hypothetical protein